MALIDALCNLARLPFLPVQVQDMKGVARLIKGVAFNELFVDEAFDVAWLLQGFDSPGAPAVLLFKANRKTQRDYGVEVYKWQQTLENYCAKIKEFRVIVTR